ncbi:MAG TPA: hypothetical protein VGP72_18635 [Planctomycetota bacterium]
MAPASVPAVVVPASVPARKDVIRAGGGQTPIVSPPPASKLPPS